jgi:hypothetical protein
MRILVISFLDIIFEYKFLHPEQKESHVLPSGFGMFVTVEVTPNKYILHHGNVIYLEEWCLLGCYAVWLL